MYADSDLGFAAAEPTHSRRAAHVPADPDDAATWSDVRIVDELHARIAGSDGFEPTLGPIVERSVLRFRSSVVEPMRLGLLVLVGDAAHTVPPTGAKGLDLAISDVVLLHRVLRRWLPSGDDAARRAQRAIRSACVARAALLHRG